MNLLKLALLITLILSVSQAGNTFKFSSPKRNINPIRYLAGNDCVDDTTYQDQTFGDCTTCTQSCVKCYIAIESCHRCTSGSF